MAKFQKGQSGNIAGRPAGRKNFTKRSPILIAAQKDLDNCKNFYRAIINNDLDVLKEYGVTKVSVSHKLEAQKQLRSILNEEIKLETERLAAYAQTHKTESTTLKTEATPIFSANPFKKVV